MLTKIAVRNFKRFHSVEVELGDTVVLVGPNNSGKTSVLQALALWEAGLRRWNEKRGGKAAPEKRPGVTINRRDLVALSVPAANLLWLDRHTRDTRTVEGKAQTKNICIEVTVSGVIEDKAWVCGLEFDYANEESFYCRPLRSSGGPDPGRMPVPAGAAEVRIAFLPPMSGLAATEDRLETGSIARRLGEGDTAEVLRNLCYRIATDETAPDGWRRLAERMHDLFGVRLDPPELVTERGELTMTYRDRRGTRLDLSSAGRGLHQTLLLLAYLQANPGAVLLLDEPDAHLEILRQRQTYQTLTEVAHEQQSQLLIATHSEILLNEAADRDIVVAFVGRPHRIDDRGHQAAKALKEIGFEDYYQAEVTGWVLYLEGSTDLAILRALATTLGHPAVRLLERPFVHYVLNQPKGAREHFFGLREAKPDLVGFALFDRVKGPLAGEGPLAEAMWRRREIENYVALPEVLETYAAASAEADALGPLFAPAEARRRVDLMREIVADIVPPRALRDRGDRWWSDTKATDEFLDRVFEDYFGRLALPNLMRKTDYHTIARLVPRDLIDPEVEEKLDLLVAAAGAAQPERDPDAADEGTA